MIKYTAFVLLSVAFVPTIFVHADEGVTPSLSRSPERVQTFPCSLIEDVAWRPGWDYNVHLWPEHVSDDIEILEIALYTSYAFTEEFRSDLKAWLKRNAGHVKYRRLPRIYSPHGRLQARMFFTLEELGRTDLHEKLEFSWVKDPRREPIYHKIWDPDEGKIHELNLAFAKQNGIDEQSWTKVFYSAAMDQKIKDAEIRLSGYGGNGTPTFVVNRKFSTSIHRIAYPRELPYDRSDYKRLISLIDYLTRCEMDTAKRKSGR